MKTDFSDRASTRQFLINCLRVFLNPEDASSFKTSPKDVVDWSALLRLASRHKVVPLLYRSLQENCMNVVPETVAGRLETLYRSVLSRSLFLTGELVRLLKLFEANGIISIPLKGQVLAFSLYGDVAMRQSVDIDILVQEEDYRPAERLLLSLGYRPQYKYTFTSRHEKVHMNSINELAFTLTRDDVMVKVELHWDMIARNFPFHQTFEGILARHTSVSIAGTTVATLSMEDLLLYLCAHSSMHNWGCLQWICDVAQLVRIQATTMDWGRVMQQAKTSGSQRMLFIGLFLANDILGAPIPHEILQKIQHDPLTVKLAMQVRSKLLNGTLVAPGTFEKMLFKLQVMEYVQDRVSYCIWEITTPTPVDWMSIPLPDTLFPLYYVLRPMRLSGKYVLKAISHIYNLCKGKIK